MGTTLFQHDPVGNLEAAVYGDFSAVFRSPDAIGNLFKDRHRTDRKYGPAGQLLESRNSEGVTTYEYDPEGNSQPFERYSCEARIRNRIAAWSERPTR